MPDSPVSPSSSNSPSSPRPHPYHHFHFHQPRHDRHDFHSHHSSLPASPLSPSSPSLPSSPPFSSSDSAVAAVGVSSTSSLPSSPTSSRPSLDSSLGSAPTPLPFRSHRKPAPSPLQTSTAISSTANAQSFSFPFPLAHSHSSPQIASDRSRGLFNIPQIVTTAPESPRSPRQPSTGPETTYFESDSSQASSPIEKSLGPPSPLPNEKRSVSEPLVSPKPPAGSTHPPRPQPAAAAATANMARPSAAAPTAVKNSSAPRNPSIDSGVSALSNSSAPHRGSDASAATTHDIPSIIKAAGSAEAVIEHLLKEKQAQAQQNAQLWRLVDKQRAMILGLNSDLERALKDKERYRKKLKEVVAEHSRSSAPIETTATASGTTSGAAAAVTLGAGAASRHETEQPPARPIVQVPASPVYPPSSPVQSPVAMSMAPYPITPPADQPLAPRSAIGDILDPVAVIPRPQDHAVDRFDHEAEEREADAARKAARAATDIPISITLPPSRSVPSKPPQVPPPRLPPPQLVMSSDLKSPAMQPADDSQSIASAQFPPPPAPPPRKPPPSPLMLRDLRANRPDMGMDDEVFESDSDYDELLEVTEIAETEKRGRRRTRSEDDREREVLALKEAEIRNLSKKSKKSSSAHQKSPPAEAPPPAAPSRQGLAPSASMPVMPALDSVLSGNHSSNDSDILPRSLAAPPMSPGLPASPRPMGASMNSPPLSPRTGGFPTSASMVALSPRPPRQPIPLPPSTPMQTPSPAPGEPLLLSTPKKALFFAKAQDATVGATAVIVTASAADTTLGMTSPTSPVGTDDGGQSPVGRTRIYKGFVTDEYPDLLLPPNALPSIEIRVASSRMKPSRASLLSLTQLEEDPVFTLAIFLRADGGELWRVEKDSASLAKLDTRLKQCSTFTARTPDRSLFSGHAPAKLDARRQALNLYLDELLNTPLDTATAIELCRYLSSNTLPPNADETGVTMPPRPQTDGQSAGQKTGPGGRPFRNGYLTKRGKNFGGWKARFFVLDGPHLKYYETPGGAHLGTIKLQNAQIGKQSQHNETSPAQAGAGPGAASGSSTASATANTTDEFDNQYRHAFLILEPKKKDPSSLTKHVLCAESDVERDQWVDALLRWIDYRNPEDEDDTSAPNAAAAAAANDSRPSSSGGVRKKMYGQGKKQAQRQQPQHPLQHHYQHSQASDSNDALIGVSYETTHQGELPQVDGGHTMSSQSPYTISAPRDPHLIADAAVWNSRAAMLGSGGGGGLAPPSTEEKKVRKRSFFGFGAKVRSSSDGPNESLYGESGGSNGAGNGNGYSGPVRQVFGAPLAEAVRYNSPVDVRVPLPAVVYRCIQYLDARNAIGEEGIFRLSGSNVVIKQLRERFNNESDVNLLTDSQYYDIHAVASLLKMYLRELPSTILTRELHMQYLAVTEMSNQDEKLAALNELSQRLPQANATLLKYLVAFLIKIINHADLNKMTVRNVGIVFSPTLNIPAPVFAMLLQNYEAIFGIEPEDYQLPSDMSDITPPPQLQQQQQQRMSGILGGGMRRPSLASSMSTNNTVDLLPARPSTSHAGESPHRQRLLDSTGGATARSTPTPPPLLSQIAHMRSTPTPPPLQPLPVPTQQQQQQQQYAATYEPQYMAQQQQKQQQGGGLRPAYESGFVLPPGYDATQLRTGPGYDRPAYEVPGAGYYNGHNGQGSNGSNGSNGNGGLAPYESPYGSRNNRRESAILPGGGNFGGLSGLNPQGSRSRLREESRY